MKEVGDCYLANLQQILEYSLNEWKLNKMRSVSIKIPHYLSAYIHIFMDKGFYFHHTKENNLIICKWLDKNSENKIPTYAHHSVGIGACIVNDNLDFLLVKENYPPSYDKNKASVWKFVTGLVEKGETVEEAVLREAKEEVNMNIITHGCILISEAFPNSQQTTDICFFNLCSIKDDIKNNQIDFDKVELKDARFFNLDELTKILNNNETSIMTKKTFKKVLPFINFKDSFSNNILNLLHANSRLFVKNDEMRDHLRFKYFNVYQ